MLKRLIISSTILLIVFFFLGNNYVKSIEFLVRTARQIAVQKSVVDIKSKNNVFSGTNQIKSVVRIVDGDTVIIDGEKIRLIGIDAPELGQIPWGVKSKGHLESILRKSNFNVMVELDVQERDRYGRILAYLWQGENMVNVNMVIDGYAVVLTVPPNVKYEKYLVDAQRYARENRKGLWKYGGFEEMPQEFRKRSKKL